MKTSAIVFPFGALIGLVVGAGSLGGAAFLVGDFFDLGERLQVTLVGILIGSGGVMGTLLGATSDILAYLHRALPLQHSQDADYREPRRAASDPR
jgi:hypothetical protein